MDCATMRSPSFIPRSWQFVFVLSVITAIFFSMRDVLDITPIVLLYLIPLGLITAFWGLRAGITSAMLSFLAINYFFIKPYYTFAVHHPTDQIGRASCRERV